MLILDYRSRGECDDMDYSPENEKTYTKSQSRPENYEMTREKSDFKSTHMRQPLHQIGRV